MAIDHSSPVRLDTCKLGIICVTLARVQIHLIDLKFPILSDFELRKNPRTEQEFKKPNPDVTLPRFRHPTQVIIYKCARKSNLQRASPSPVFVLADRLDKITQQKPNYPETTCSPTPNPLILSDLFVRCLGNTLLRATPGPVPPATKR